MAQPKRERPRAFAEDWQAEGTPRPPTSVANPLGRVDIAASPLTEDEVAAARGVDRGGGIDLSPDGREVAFAWERDGSLEIYTAPLDSDRIIQLTQGKARSVAPRWSPDGRWVAFVRGGAGHSSLWVVDRDGEREREVSVGDAGDALHDAVRLSAEGVPTWSPEAGEAVLGSAGVDHVRGSARTSPDGSTIAFVTRVDGKSKIAFAQLGEGAVARIEVLGRGTPFDDIDPVWRPDGRGVLYRRREHGDMTVRRVFTTSHADEAVIDVPGWIFSPRVGLDSETVVAILVDRQGADVVVRPRGGITVQRLTRSAAA